MKKIYTEKDLDLISWERVEQFVDKIYNDVKKYIEENNLHIKYIVPILRGGGIPSIMLSHMLNVVDILPIQLKNNSETHNVDIKLDLKRIENLDINNNECILLVEGNQDTGRTANIAVNIIKEKFGKNVKIIYVSLSRDYSYRDNVKDVCYTTWAMSTNEMQRMSEQECKKLKISYNLVSVYPWENITEELKELNENLNESDNNV